MGMRDAAMRSLEIALASPFKDAFEYIKFALTNLGDESYLTDSDAE